MTSINLYQIEKSADDIRQTVLNNAVKMITNRGLLNQVDLDANLELITKMHSDDQIYELTLKDNSKLIIKYAPHKVTAVNKSFGVNEFIQNYPNHHKIIIIKAISKKAEQQFTRDESVEVFLEHDLMINIVDHILVPHHELLSNDEVLVFYDKFNCKKKNMPRIQNTDPVAKYYNMKVGQICRIIRPSEKSGFATTYRLVVKGLSK